jgi:signal transduction histidine kinase/ligand-binding sensor domain-containing protein/CheY-like chemotaxis protein/AraC-like DNA-binding protein
MLELCNFRSVIFYFMIKLIKLLLFITCISSSVNAQPGNLIFHRISPPEGFTFGSIYCIEEDANGFIWFGTEYGLYRYNSRTIELFQNSTDDPNSIPANNVYSLYKDISETLWVGTINGLCYFDEKHEKFIKPDWKFRNGDKGNNHIRSIIENQEGEKFIMMHLNNVYRVNTENDSIIPILLPGIYPNEYPTKVIFDSDQNLCIGTSMGSFYMSSPPYNEFKLFFHNREDRIQAIFQDNNTYWIGYELSGIDHINNYGLVIETYQDSKPVKVRLPNNSVRSIIKDSENRIWVGTYKGLAIISRGVSETIDKTPYNFLPHNSIHSLKTDSKGGVWIGTWSGGLAFVGKHDNKFMHLLSPSQPQSINNSIVSSFATDNNGNLWIGTEDGGLNRLSHQDKSFEIFKPQIDHDGRLNIKAICFDQHNTLWIGTYASGLWSYNIKDNRFKHHQIFETERINIYDLQVSDNILWMGTWGSGVYSLDLKTGELINYTSSPADPNSLSSNLVRSLLVDSYEGIWVGTQLGLNYLPKGSKRFIRYFYNVTESRRISRNEVLSLHEDSHGKIWIGTGGGGVDVLEPGTGNLSNISRQEGLSGNNVYGILETRSGDFWFSTENGLTCYNPENHKFSYYNKEDGLQGNHFNPNAAFMTDAGELLFGGSNGFNIFQPDRFSENIYPPKVYITNLEINNKKILAAHSDSPLKEAIHRAKEVSLKFHENSLTFEFIANNFNQPYKNQFKYRLVNYQDEWIDLGSEAKAIFTKVPPGKYIFEVTGSNNSGVWSPDPTRLTIKIAYPLWRSNLAYMFYTLILLVAVWIIKREIVIRQKLRSQVLIEKVQRENEEKLHQMKLQIFTNISHEFRTPLTLILSPLELIMGKKYFDSDTKEHLDMIQRNARRLRMLINQIIDFRRFELNKPEYTPAKTDIISTCMDICNHFEVHARDKNISFAMTSAFKKYEIDVDQDKLEKIVFNLLSNAFKHTPEGGTICLNVDESETLSKEATVFSTHPEMEGPVMAIKVTNSGTGVSEEEIPHIFERFYKGTPGKYQGTGIGLHLCREYSRLHGGAITVENIPQKGIAFSLLLPLKDKGQIEEAIAKPMKNWISKTSDPKSGQDNQKPDNDPIRETSASVLVVEDNSDMQKQIKRLLQDKYKVIVASNGLQGYEMAREIFPDIIISDVVMPGMDGFEMCKKIKEDILTSHMPVILLTALSETEKQIDGLETGADAFIVKPFDNKLLMAQIKNLIASRGQLKKSFTESAEKWADNNQLNQRDKRLVIRAVQIVEKHLLDPAFSVEHLADKLGISRSSLHRKMKVLTNQSATEFIRYVRMKKALKLMKEGDLNIDEIGFAVGFNSHSYFTQCFKKLYGKTPTEYLAELKSSEKAK